MRIITGSARGIPLSTLPGDNTRPTLEKAKEAIFSMLQFDIEGRRVLDLFAGSGQMALEALSRGAADAVLVDSSRQAVEVIKKNAQKTRLDGKCLVICADYATYLKGENNPFDIVFLDPPYASDYIEKSLGILWENNLLKQSSILVLESDKGDLPIDSERFTLVRKNKYGIAYIYVLNVNR